MRAHLPLWLVSCLFSSVAVFLLWTEPSVPALRVLPYLLLVACPVLHLLQHWTLTHHQQRGRTREAPLAPSPPRHPSK